MSSYEFDSRNISFRKVRMSVQKVVRTVLLWFIGTFSLAVCYYFVLAFFISTDTEKRLIRENRVYERTYEEMERKQQLISEVTSDLQQRDNAIYEQIFHTSAPAVDPVGESDFRTQGRIAELKGAASRVEDNFTAVFGALAGSAALPPMTIPVDNLTYAQIGASVGQKVNPFYKVETRHDGLDIIAAQGDLVRSAADGTVSDVTRSGKGLGNVVEIDHGNGYVTRYGHLGDIYVSKGQRVKRGARIAAVGISGKSFAPHLHYEVLRDGVTQDPVNYFFASLSPQDYANVAFMSSSTGQTLD